VATDLDELTSEKLLFICSDVQIAQKEIVKIEQIKRFSRHQKMVFLAFAGILALTIGCCVRFSSKRRDP
jgi:hypothetical protein